MIGQVVGDPVDDDVGHEGFIEGAAEIAGDSGDVGVDAAGEPRAVGVDAGVVGEAGGGGSGAQVPLAGMGGAIAGARQVMGEGGQGGLSCDEKVSSVVRGDTAKIRECRADV